MVFFSMVTFNKYSFEIGKLSTNIALKQAVFNKYSFEIDTLSTNIALKQADFQQI